MAELGEGCGHHCVAMKHGEHLIVRHCDCPDCHGSAVR